jgi:hypothetical protein
LISNDVLEQNSLHKLNDLLAQPNDVSEEIEVDEYKIESIIKNMSNGKMAGHCGVSADMIKCLTFKTKTQNQVEHEQTLVTPPNTIVKTIKLILDVIFKFNVFPKDFNLSIMIPLIKDPSKSRSDLNNIRPISISGYLSNIYERLILSMVDQRHKQPEKQFGFNKNCSCSHAVFVLMETLKYIKKKQKLGIITAIDASKAFDKVNRILLWLTLCGKVGRKITISLIRYYSISKAYVLLNGEKSEIFITTIGVKQGGPLSPRLFALYIEHVVKVLDDSGYGINIGQMVINILLYADDIILFANNKVEMQKMINIVESFGNGLEIKFNPKKTNFLEVNGKLRKYQLANNVSQAPLRMNNQDIEQVDTMKYLGNILNSNLSNDDHLNNRIRLAAAAMFNLNEAGYDENLDAFTIMQLYKTYSRTTLLYGIENLCLNVGELNRVSKFEKSLLKKSLKFAPYHHSDHLLDALKLNNMDEKIHVIKLSFYIRILNNNYTKEFAKNLLNLYKGVPQKNSIFRYALDNLESKTSLNKYLTTQKLKEYAELSLENTKQKFKNRFKYDESAITMRGLLWNLADNRILIEEMLEPLGMRFPDSNKLLLPYDMVLSDTRI